MNDKYNLGIYVHWPFCEKKCPYCDFNSHVAKISIDSVRWSNAFLKQLSFFISKIDVDKYNVKSIFFGGGTPSLMDHQIVADVVNYVRDNFDVSDDLEVSLESNPSSSEAKKFELFRNAGVNRLSLGVQSLNDDDLKWLGRVHDSKQALYAMEIATDVFDNYSFDIMYGRSGQTLDKWKREFEKIISLAGNHLSLYNLTIEKGTEFFSLYNKGKLDLPSDDVRDDIYFYTQDIMKQNGFNRYEVSNYEKNNSPCLHNLIYWQCDSYIGIGAGAHGRFFDKRDLNFYESVSIYNPEKWINAVEKDLNDLCGLNSINKIDKNHLTKDVIMMGLRLKSGLSVVDTFKKFGIDLNTIIATDAFGNLFEKGLIVENDGYLKATETGFNFLNYIVSSII